MSLLATLALACTWKTDLPASAKEIAIDPRRELIVSDDATLSQPMASNRAAGALSFRHVAESLPLADGALLRWLAVWSTHLRDAGAAAQAAALDAQVTCHWLRARPENGCDDDCSSCAARELSLAEAPLRLIAVVNRTDLSVMPDRAADGGEGRLVFAVTDGAADDPASPPLAMTVIVEYAQRGAALEWAKRWHSLGQASDVGASLTELTESLIANGALAQLRTADAAGGPMRMHQFELQSGELVATGVRNTPDWGTVGEDAIRLFATDHADEIAAGAYVLPRAWWAPSSSPTDVTPTYFDSLPQHDALLRGTCGGCHAQSISGFQVDPTRPADQRLSSFLSDPSSDQDELRRRAEWMQMTLWNGGSTLGD